MSALQDLQASVARANTSLAAELKAIADKLASFGDDVKASDVEAAVAQINTLSDQLDAETAQLQPPQVGG
jgi:flagellar hook-associated protein FlgK